jgi:alkylated DNA repair dioxygenase AlkB
MKPIYIEKFISKSLYDKLKTEAPWINADAPRDECFMSLIPLEYIYGHGFIRTYKSVDMHNDVKNIMEKMNAEMNTEYNVCFLNFYKSEKEALGWHADDSPEMDTTHPIAVISFGAERFIWTKEKSYKGVVPDGDKYLLNDGSLFIMPAGFQKENYHKIPRHDRPCGGRISLTYRKFKNEK